MALLVLTVLLLILLAGIGCIVDGSILRRWACAVDFCAKFMCYCWIDLVLDFMALLRFLTGSFVARSFLDWPSGAVSVVVLCMRDSLFGLCPTRLAIILVFTLTSSNNLTHRLKNGMTYSFFAFRTNLIGSGIFRQS